MRATRLVTVPALVAAGVTAVLGATAAPATAGAGPAPYVHTAGGPQRDADAQSSVAGYVATLDGTARRSATGTFTVPAVTCRARSDGFPLFVTIGLFGTTAGPSTGFDYVAAELMITCTRGVPSYQASVISSPDRQSAAVSPGDVLQATLTTTSRTSAVVLTDQTSGGVFRVEGGGVEPTTAQASVQGGYADLSFPRFGSVRFQGVKVSNAAIGTYSPTSFDQATAEGKLVLETSPLVADRSSTVTFRAQP